METFNKLYRRFAPDGDDAVQRWDVSADEPAGNAALVLTYVSATKPVTLRGLATAVQNLQDEEELAAFWCDEGLAISCASDGWWVLFTDRRNGD
jgi:hypothetical protein